MTARVQPAADSKWTRIAAGLLIALWLVCAWRAATQSIVHDEALTYQLYLAGPASEMFNHFDANHHFLNTILMRISTGIGGFSPLAMRVPALIGAALFFSALFRFCRWAFGSGWLLPVAVAAVSLNPFLLDFMVAARGYGLALGLWTWALALIAPNLQKTTQGEVHDRRSVMLAGASAALSVTANLIFVPPVAALTAIVLWSSMRARRDAETTSGKSTLAKSTRAASPGKTAVKKRGRVEAGKGTAAWLDFLIPAGVIAIAFLLLAPLEHAAGEHFYAGAASLAESLRSLAALSLDHGGPGAYRSLSKHLVDFVAFGFAPLILIAGAIVAVRFLDFALILTAMPALGSAVILLALHFALATPFPADRTGIYFVPAVTLALLSLLRINEPAIHGAANFEMRWLAFAAPGFAVLMVLCFLIQFDPRFFGVWKYDAEAGRIAERLAEMVKTKPGMNVVTSWQLEPALNFYRETRHLDPLPPFTRRAVAPGFDVYVLMKQDRADAGEFGLTILYTGPVSETVIAVPGR